MIPPAGPRVKQPQMEISNRTAPHVHRTVAALENGDDAKKGGGFLRLLGERILGQGINSVLPVTSPAGGDIMASQPFLFVCQQHSRVRLKRLSAKPNASCRFMRSAEIARLMNRKKCGRSQPLLTCFLERTLSAVRLCPTPFPRAACLMPGRKAAPIVGSR
jgi:hypothetical protein